MMLAIRMLDNLRVYCNGRGCDDGDKHCPFFNEWSGCELGHPGDWTDEIVKDAAKAAEAHRVQPTTAVLRKGCKWPHAGRRTRRPEHYGAATMNVTFKGMSPKEAVALLRAADVLAAAVPAVAQPAQATNSASLSIPALAEKWIASRASGTTICDACVRDFAAWAQEQQA